MVQVVGAISLSVNGFRPLTGIVPDDGKPAQQRQSFRPLTGIVHGDDWYFLADAGFRPLMGMVLDCLILTH